jgi:hypothetical protein
MRNRNGPKTRPHGERYTTINGKRVRFLNERELEEWHSAVQAVCDGRLQRAQPLQEAPRNEQCNCHKARGDDKAL